MFTKKLLIISLTIMPAILLSSYQGPNLYKDYIAYDRCDSFRPGCITISGQWIVPDAMFYGVQQGQEVCYLRRPDHKFVSVKCTEQQYSKSTTQVATLYLQEIARMQEPLGTELYDTSNIPHNQRPVASGLFKNQNFK